MKPEIRKRIKQFLIEFLVYALFVTIYYLVVLHFLGSGLKELYQNKRSTYAALALGLIVGQGLLLEVITRLMLGWIQPRTED